MDTEVEIVNVRAVAIGKVDSPKLPTVKPGDSDASKAIVDDTHEAYFDNAFQKTLIYDRHFLVPNNRITGPAIVTQKDSTTLILPGNVAVVDENLNLLIQREA